MAGKSGTRGAWSGQLAFVLAASASAVGLGNIWRFPYLAARNGGGIFLLCYIAITITLGYAMMIAEVSLGRRTGLAPLEAFGAARREIRWLGWLCTAIPALILPYYCVIGGWILKYLVHYVHTLVSSSAPVLTVDAAALAAQNISAAVPNDYFNAFLGAPTEPLWFGWAFVLMVGAFILMGVKNGIEKSNLVMMPLLLILCVLVAAAALMQPGSSGGLAYFFKPDFSKFSSETIVTAMGQAFYSLSLAMGIMVAYGSYMRKEDSIEKSVCRIAFFDTLIAVLAGVMVVPAVYAFADPGDPTHGMNAGPGLMFINLPNVFHKMAFGNVVGTVFFVLVLFAALTSAISLFETVVASLCDATGWRRRTATLATLVFCLVLSAPSALCYGSGPLGGKLAFGKEFLDLSDYVSNIILMPIAAYFISLVVGWDLKPEWVAAEVKAVGGKFIGEKVFSFIIRYVAPVVMLLILLAGLGIAKF